MATSTSDHVRVPVTGKVPVERRGTGGDGAVVVGVVVLVAGMVVLGTVVLVLVLVLVLEVVGTVVVGGRVVDVERGRVVDVVEVVDVVVVGRLVVVVVGRVVVVVVGAVVVVVEGVDVVVDVDVVVGTSATNEAAPDTSRRAGWMMRWATTVDEAKTLGRGSGTTDQATKSFAPAAAMNSNDVAPAASVVWCGAVVTRAPEPMSVTVIPGTAAPAASVSTAVATPG